MFLFLLIFTQAPDKLDYRLTFSPISYDFNKFIFEANNKTAKVFFVYSIDELEPDEIIEFKKDKKGEFMKISSRAFGGMAFFDKLKCKISLKILKSERDFNSAYFIVGRRENGICIFTIYSVNNFTYGPNYTIIFKKTVRNENENLLF